MAPVERGGRREVPLPSALQRVVRVVALSALGGCTSTSDLIDEGDRMRSEKRLDEALDRYREAQERSDLGGSEGVRVARARGEVLLERGDLNGAEQSFRRMPESSGTRSALLATGGRNEAQ